MASSLSVNLSMKSPHGSKPRKKSFRITKTIRSLLPNASAAGRSEFGSIERAETEDVLPRIEQPVRDTGDMVDISAQGKLIGKKSSRSSQTSARSPRTSRKVHKVRRSKVLQENAQIEWVVPEHVQGSRRLHQGQQATGTGDHLTSSDIEGEKELFKGRDEERASKHSKHKNGSHPSVYVYGHNRSSRHSRHNRIRPTSRNGTPVRRSEAMETIEVLSRNCEIYREELRQLEEKNAKEILQLEKENEKLQLEVFHLQQEVGDWKAKCQRQENRNVTLARLKILTKENQNLKDDVEVLKSVIRRLNKEISYYQEKLRSKYRKDPHKIPFYSSSNTNSNGEDDQEHEDPWLSSPRAKLQPLLVAYDEIISEKTEIIKDYELAMESFKLKCQDVVRENEQLHKARTESKEKGSVSFEDWQFLYDNAVLVLEENDLLHEHIAALKRKAGVIQKNQEERESKLQLKISLLEEERGKMKVVNTQLDSHCKALAEQVAKLSQSIQSRIPVEEHEASVRECKRLFEELKTNYAEDRKALVDKIAAMETEKHRLVVEVTDLGTENAKLQGTIKDLENSLANNHAKLKEMYAKMQEASKAKEATAKTVAEMMEMAKAVVQDRETLEKSLFEQKNLNERMMSIRSQESELVNELREKIKIMEEAHAADIQKYINKIKELESVLDTIGERHQADIFQLKDLIQEKTTHIEMLIAEKNQLALDLETVWRATTSSAKK